MPAIDRYNGPSFRVLRRFLRETLISSVDVKILSGKYGLISTDYLVPYYDCHIKNSSDFYSSRVVAGLKVVLSEKEYTSFLICLGKDYLEKISGYESIIPGELTVQVARGGIGRKLSILYDWLYEDLTSFRHNKAFASPKSQVFIRDVEVKLTQKEIFSIARQAIREGVRRATAYQSWYVDVDEHRVAPKWLVSEITGLSVGNFVTNDARRVLTQLGIEVKRV
jgi:hypothetical protein